jgi:hypothetical protein
MAKKGGVGRKKATRRLSVKKQAVGTGGVPAKDRSRERERKRIRSRPI